MKKFTVFAALLSLLTLAVFSGCNSSSSDSGGVIIEPPASHERVGAYKIEKIVSVSGVNYPFDTSKPEQVLDFDGEMVVANNTLKIDGKYQVVGYSEYLNRPPTPADKYFTYNKFSADNASVAMTLVSEADKRYTLQVTDTESRVLELTVVQQNNNVLAIPDYQTWTSADYPGNPYWRNQGFNVNSQFVPTNLIGNYMITKVVIEKNGQSDTIVNTTSSKTLVGELSVTADHLPVQLNIVVKMQIDPASIVNTGFSPYVYDKSITDTITPVGDLGVFLKELFPKEGMDIVQGSNTDIVYTPKKRNNAGELVDYEINGAKVKLYLSKIINGSYNASVSTKPAKELTDREY